MISVIGLPILILLGDYDFVRLEHAVETFRLIPNAELAAVPPKTSAQSAALFHTCLNARSATAASGRPGVVVGRERVPVSVRTVALIDSMAST